MKKLLSTIILVILFPLLSYSQNSYSNGYIILNYGDTIFGMIKNGSNIENTRNCEFKKDKTSQSISYSANDILQYRLENNRYFVSKKLNENDESKRFLEFLFDGIINLYDYFDESGVHFLIEKNENQLTELKNETQKIRVNGVIHERESKEYIGVLKTLLKESPTVSQRAESSLLNLNSLIDLSEEYHKETCPNEECIIYAKKRNKIKLSPGLIVGISIPQVLLRVPTSDIAERLLLPSVGMGSRIGAVIYIEDLFFSRRLGVQTGLSLSNTKYSTDSSNLHVTTLNFPLQINYGIPMKRFKTSVLAGINYNRLLKFDYSSASYGNFNLGSSSYQVGIIVGTEVSFNTKSNDVIFLQIKYEKNVGEHIGKWSGKNYGQWGGLGYDHAQNVFDTKENCLVFLLGFRL